jgi:hypothetical protein
MSGNEPYEDDFELDDELSRATTDGSLRSPVLDDGQPALTWWLPLPGVTLALLWAAYQAVSAQPPGIRVLLGTLAWPGAAVFAATTLVTYLGWRLDLD